MVINGFGNANVYPILIDRVNGTSTTGQPITERETPVEIWNPESYGYRWKDSTFYGTNLYGGSPISDDFTFFTLGKDGTFSMDVMTESSLESGFNLLSGCVSNDQRHLLLLENRRRLPTQGGGYDPTLPNLLHKINLETGNYEFDETILLQGMANSDTIGIVSTDIAVDPVSGLGYSFDIFSKRLVTIDLETGMVDNTSYPVIDFDATYDSRTPRGLFFDAFNRLYGIAHDMYNQSSGSYLFEFDKSSGTIAHVYPFTPPSDTAKIYDGCSCPMTVALEKELRQEELRQCQTTEAVVKVAFMNQFILASPVNFRDSFPSGVEVQEVLYNPYGGDISGIGSNVLNIQNLQPKLGVDSIIVRLSISEQMNGGDYTCQASLYDVNLSAMGDERTAILSDYLPTPAFNDATPFSVTELEALAPILSYEKCEDASLTLRPFENTAGLNFLWENGATSDTLEVSDARFYDVTVDTGCESFEYTIEVKENLLSVDLGQDQALLFGESIVLSPSIQHSRPLTEYLWSSTDTSSLSCSICPTVEVMPTQTTSTVSLRVEDENGCVAEGEMELVLERPVYAPTAFSPNDDGRNDYFAILTPSRVTMEYLRIYDRWGGLVWEAKNGYTNSIEYGWNGKFNSNTAISTGVYLWSARLIYPDGLSQELSGEVSLVR
jgi:gliding motility-associated-like protein